MNYTLEVMRGGKFFTLLEGSMHPETMPLSARELEVLRLTSEGHPEKSSVIYCS